MQNCPPEETVETYLSGALPPARRPEVAAHVDGCRSCHQVVARLSRRFSLAGPPGEPTARLTGGDVAAAPAGLTRGQRIGRYLILGNAGAGGMGAVYAAYDSLLDRKIALKFLTGTGAGDDPAALARVLAEAGAMARLSHPNVVTVHDVGTFEGAPYLAMELVEGTTLGGWRKQQPRSFRELARVMAAAARGLAAAHAEGIVHRDVKPDNILVAGDRVVVTDFGLSVRSDVAAAASIAGTPAYMAPEQFRGERVDARTDVFGFCATLFEMLHGQRPFTGPGLAELREQVLAGQVAAPAGRTAVPPRLHRLALRGLDPDPARRPPSLEAIADELLDDPAARRGRRALGAGLVLTVAAAFWGGGYLKANPERQCRAAAAAVDGAWSEAHRQRLRERYADVGQAAGFDALAARLDAFARGWREMYGETCAATYGKRVQSDQVFDLRVQCLNAQRGSVAAFVGALGSADRAQLVTALAATLPGVQDCASAGRAETKPLPVDPGARARIAAVEEGLAQAMAEENLGDYPGAARSAAQAAAAAREIGYEPLLASALVRLGSLEVRRAGNGAGGENPLEKGAQALEEAYAVAEVGRDDRTRLAAARELVSMQVRRGQFPSAEMWLRLARALLDRLGQPPLDAATLATYEGLLHYNSNRVQEAAAAFARGADWSRKVVPPDPRRLAAAQGYLCEAEPVQAKAVVCWRRTIALARQAYGPDHPLLGNFYFNAAQRMNQRHTMAEGCALVRQALPLVRTNLDSTSPITISLLIRLAACQEVEGRSAEARRTFEETLARRPGPPDRAYVLQSYSIFLLSQGETALAVTHARTALADQLADLPPSHDIVLYARWRLALALHEDGKRREAHREVDLALQAIRAEQVRSAEAANIYGVKGWLLTRDGRPREALELVTEAVERHAALKSPEEEQDLSLHAMGMANLQLGRSAAALPYLERALDVVRGRAEYGQSREAEVGFALARALTDAARQKGAGVGNSDSDRVGAPARACTAAEQALRLYRKDKRSQRQAAEVARWLSHQRCAADA